MVRDLPGRPRDLLASAGKGNPAGCVVRRPAGVGDWVGLRTCSLGSSGCIQQDSLVLELVLSCSWLLGCWIRPDWMISRRM